MASRKLLPPKPIPFKDKAQPVYIRVCPYCKQEFPTSSTTQTYCTRAHKKQANKRRQRERQYAKRNENLEVRDGWGQIVGYRTPFPIENLELFDQARRQAAAEERSRTLSEAAKPQDLTFKRRAPKEKAEPVPILASEKVPLPRVADISSLVSPGCPGCGSPFVQRDGWCSGCQWL